MAPAGAAGTAVATTATGAVAPATTSRASIRRRGRAIRTIPASSITASWSSATRMAAAAGTGGVTRAAGTITGRAAGAATATGAPTGIAAGATTTAITGARGGTRT